MAHVDRRDALASGAAAVAVAALSGKAAAKPRHFTFVLVHGAWHGGWCWRHVADPLRAKGHWVFTPTLTGQGERLHLASPAVVHETHVQDILGVIEAEELTNIILVGHSYGGIVISAVGDRLQGRVKKLVYLDALLPVAGKPVFDFPPEVLARYKAGLIDGFKSPPFPTEQFGVPKDHPLFAWVDRRITTMCSGVFETPVVLSPAWEQVPRCYIEAKQNTLEATLAGAQRAKAEGWEMHSIDTGHNVMVTAPEALVQRLLKIAKAA
jgi:pimeloyl-ACP methyl ester carboxylesterase